MEKQVQVLVQAEKLFRAQGVAKTSMQDIASACGISKGALYLVFRSKRDLIIALLHYLGDKVLREVQRIRINKKQNADDRFKAQIIYQFEEFREQTMLVEMLFKETDLKLDQELLLLARKMRADWQTCLKDFLLDCFGPSSEPFLDDLTIIINGLVTEYQTLVLLDHIQLNAAQIADFLHAFSGHTLTLLQKGAPLVGPLVAQANLELVGAWRLHLQERAAALIKDMQDILKDKNPPKYQSWIMSLDLLLDEYRKEDPQPLILQGLLANLRPAIFLKRERHELAQLLNVPLI